MQALVGTTTSAPCIAVADKTAADNMFQITPSGSAVECAANPNVYRVCYSDPAQVQHLLNTSVSTSWQAR